MELSVFDNLQRPLRDLRISVTDRCNFRCPYCMPKEIFGRDYVFLPRAEVLTYEEIARLTRIFAGLGVEKARITGGEPLMRRDVDKLVRLIADQTYPAGKIADITLTTNGARLSAMVSPLRDAGLQRVTVSLDSLDDETFGRMNGVGIEVARVLGGIAATQAAGLPVKVNMVVRRGINDGDILPMARHFRGTGCVLRFIEYMDVGMTNGWRLADVVPAAEIVGTVDSTFPLEPVEPSYPGEVARRYRYRDGAGEIGIIASVTQPFCRGCTRARLSADGVFYTCLFADRGYDLRRLLRGGADDAAIESAIRDVWRARVDHYSEIRTVETTRLSKIEMSRIGG